MDIEDRWQGLIIASDGAWDALTPDAIWRSFSGASNSAVAESEDEKLTVGLQTMVEACCMSEYWTSHGYDADNTTAIALSFNGAFAPGEKGGKGGKGKAAAEDCKEEVRAAALVSARSRPQPEPQPQPPVRCARSQLTTTTTIAARSTGGGRREAGGGRERWRWQRLGPGRVQQGQVQENGLLRDGRGLGARPAWPGGRKAATPLL